MNKFFNQPASDILRSILYKILRFFVLLFPYTIPEISHIPSMKKETLKIKYHLIKNNNDKKKKHLK